ncbi:hypothetical protein PSAC2689_40562 [Paraburkholderia sacchari]
MHRKIMGAGPLRISGKWKASAGLAVRENPHDLLEYRPLQPCPFALAVCVFLAPHRAPQRTFLPSFRNRALPRERC